MLDQGHQVIADPVYVSRSQTTARLDLMETFDGMERREADLHSSWEKLSTSATPEPPLLAVSAGELSVNDEEDDDDESLPLLSRKIAAKRQGRCPASWVGGGVECMGCLHSCPVVGYSHTIQTGGL